MTPRERFIAALERRPITGRVPHFELVFFPTMQAIGRVHPQHRVFGQWQQMSPLERKCQVDDVADTYIRIARKYEHGAIFLTGPRRAGVGDYIDIMAAIREQSGDEFFLATHGDATFALPNGDKMMDFVERIADDRQGLKDEAQQRVDNAIATAQRYVDAGVLDGFCLCADYCFNSGPFLSPAMFDELVTPYLTRLVQAYRQMGLYVIKHTDGNIMPILDSLVSAGPHALHSLDPQGGVDIAEVKRLVGDKVCLIGNVNCGLLDTGTDEQIAESARYALRHGMPGGGYIFSTSNCVYPGMDLARYELILEIWRTEGNYERVENGE
jgi:uroporphyrinogen decarboxylase